MEVTAEMEIKAITHMVGTHHLPCPGKPLRQALPVNACGEPGELHRGHRPGVAVAVPDKMVQAAGAEPDAVAVPQQHLYAGAGLIGKHEGCSIVWKLQ